MGLTKEQLAQRMNGLGSSDIPKVAGLSSFGTPLEVYQEKTGASPPFSGNMATEIGEAFEEPIGRLAEMAKGWGPGKKCTATLVHKDYPWAMATPDFFYGNMFGPDMFLECKNVGWKMGFSWGEEHEGAIAIPPYYRAQVIWQMAVTGVHEAWLAAVVGGSSLRVFRIPWSDIQADALLDCGRYFWEECVQKRNPHALSGLETRHVEMRKLFPKREKV